MDNTAVKKEEDYRQSGDSEFTIMIGINLRNKEMKGLNTSMRIIIKKKKCIFAKDRTLATATN